MLLCYKYELFNTVYGKNTRVIRDTEERYEPQNPRERK